jgi:hypothetical protein
VNDLSTLSMHDAISSIARLNYYTAIWVFLSEGCVLAALPPSSHLQGPCRVGGIFHSADGWHRRESYQNQLVFRLLERSTGVSPIRRLHELEAPPV